MMTHNDELVMDKIAHAYRFGGVKQIRQVLSDFLGLKIDFHYVIDLAIFKKIIDAVGGVEIDVQQDLKYEDKAGGLKIDITKGKQLLNGHDAEGFVRYRDEKQGDLGRIERQQQFIKAFSQKISSLKELSWENIKLIGRLPGFAVDLFRDIDTDMSLDFFLKLYMAYSDRSFRNLHYATLGGEGEYLRDFTTKKWISYYISTRQDRYKSSAWLLDRAVEDIFIVNEEFAWLSSLSVSEQRMVSGVDSLSGQIVTTVSNSLSQLSSMTAASQAGQDFVTDSVISLPVETVLAVVPVSVSTTDIPVKKVEDSVSGSILETMPVSVSDLTVKTNAEVTLEPFLLESSVANKNITSGFVFTQEEIKAAVSELPLRFSTSSMVVSSTGAALIMTE
jgi:LCP family protein required for cell wall assembly